MNVLVAQPRRPGIVLSRGISCARHSLLSRILQDIVGLNFSSSRETMV